MNVLSALPSTWAVATLLDVAVSAGGGTPSKADPAYWVGGSLPWVSPKDMKVFHLTASEDSVTEKALNRLSLIPKESVLVVVRSGILSRTFPVALNSIPVTINQDMRAFIPEKSVSARYLALQLIANEREVLTHCSKHGTTVASVEGPSLARFPFALAPEREQTRIVEKLEELLSDLDAGVAELKAAQKKLAQYRQALLKAAVEGTLTAEWRAAHAPLPPCGGGAGGEGWGRLATQAAEEDPWLQARARALRKQQTPDEQSMWQQLRAKRFSSYKFRRQQPLGRFIVDFVCFSQRLIVEIDGGQHAEAVEYDKQRDTWLKRQGFHVLRFWNNEWRTQPEGVLEAIWLALQQEPPLPNPSPARGEGLKHETGAQLLARILAERRHRWEEKQLARFKQQGKTPPKGWQDKYPEPVQPDTTGLPELPEGWVWASLDQLSEFITSGSRGWADYYAPSGATFIRSQNINKDWLDLTDIAFVNPPPSSEGARTRVSFDDLLLTITGANVGKVARVDVDLDEAYVSQHVALIRLVDATLSGYLHMFLTAEAGGRGQLNKEAYGAGKPGLNLQQVGAVAVPMPGQQEVLKLMGMVSALVNATNEQVTAIGHSLKQSAAQRQNLLKAAFSGQLVPQDPDDEPASVLLERIRAERATRAGDGKPRGRKPKEPSCAQA